MSENSNTTPAAEANGTAAKRSPMELKDERTFATEEEARKAGKKEGCEKWQLWCYTGPRGGKAIYLWANGRGQATHKGAKADGPVVTCLDREPMDKAQVAAGLAALSPEERAILIAQYVPAPVPAPEKVKGKKQ